MLTVVLIFSAIVVLGFLLLLVYNSGRRDTRSRQRETSPGENPPGKTGRAMGED